MRRLRPSTFPRWPIGPGLASLAVVAGCAAPVFVPPAPLSARISDLDVAELGASIRAELRDGDFDYPFDDWLVLDPRGTALFVKGVIDGDSFEDIYHVLNHWPEIDTLVFTQIPGSMDDETNLAMGRALRQAGLTVYLPKDAEIASGGTDLFLSGTRRIVERGARVGVHSWSAGLFFGPVAADLPRDHPDHAKYLDYYRALGIDEDFYWFTLRAAPADGMHWMTVEEMARYGIFTELVD